MKLTTRNIQLLACITIAITISALTTFAAPTKATPHRSIHAPSSYASAEQNASITALPSILNVASFEQDHSALRSKHFNMRGPTLYAITTSTGYAPAIRRARIRRKGNLHG